MIHGIYGVDARLVDTNNGVAGYISKLHFELARADLKGRPKSGNRTPWQLAVDGIRWGDKTDLARWCEFVKATKGKRIFSVSKTIKDRYGTPASVDRSDEDLAAEDVAATPEAAIGADVWGHARHAQVDESSVIARAITALEDGTVDDLAASLQADLDRPLVIERRLGRVPLIRFPLPGEKGWTSDLGADAERYDQAAEEVRAELRANRGRWGARRPQLMERREATRTGDKRYG